MHISLLVVIPKSAATQIADVKQAVAEVIQNLDDDYFERRGIPRFDAWSLGGRYASDAPDAEKSPSSPWTRSVRQGVECAGLRVLEPEEQSFFGQKLMLPVRELTDNDFTKFAAIAIYRGWAEEELVEKARASRTFEEYLRSLAPDDIAVIVDAHCTTREEEFLLSMKHAFGFEPDSATLWTHIVDDEDNSPTGN